MNCLKKHENSKKTTNLKKLLTNRTTRDKISELSRLRDNKEK